MEYTNELKSINNENQTQEKQETLQRKQKKLNSERKNIKRMEYSFKMNRNYTFLHFV